MPSLALLGFGLVLTGVALGVLTVADRAPPRLVELAVLAGSGAVGAGPVRRPLPAAPSAAGRV